MAEPNTTGSYLTFAFLGTTLSYTLEQGPATGAIFGALFFLATPSPNLKSLTALGLQLLQVGRAPRISKQLVGGCRGVFVGVPGLACCKRPVERRVGEIEVAEKPGLPYWLPGCVGLGALSCGWFHSPFPCVTCWRAIYPMRSP